MDTVIPTGETVVLTEVLRFITAVFWSLNFSFGFHDDKNCPLQSNYMDTNSETENSTVKYYADINKQNKTIR